MDKNEDFVTVDLGDPEHTDSKPSNLDSSITQNNNKRCRLPSLPSKTDIPRIELDSADKLSHGVPIKPAVKHEVRHIKYKVARQLLYSAIRNGLCWLFVFGIIGICIISRDGSEWLQDERVSVLVLVILGLVGVPFQAFHTIRELKNKHPSAIAWMLRQSHDRKDFENVVLERQASPPYLAVEIALKSGAIALNKDPNHWMQTSRRNIKILNCKSWTDTSLPISGQYWMDLDSFWIILTKEYKFLNKEVEATTQKEVAQFKRDCELDKFLYFMTFQYVLDVQEGNYFPDAEVCLVYKGEDKPRLYHWNTYTVCLCMAMDFMYQVAFFAKTRYAKEYYYTKFIER